MIIPFNYQLLSWTIENLIKNSIDAIKGRGFISIELIEKINTIEINIEDNGVGIKHEDINKIFTPGFTSKKRGWGLGLSLAKRIIVDFHKGKINVKSTKIGKGSLFQILLNK